MNTTDAGRSGANAKGSVTTDVARMKSTLWVSPNQVPTATTAPNRSRHRPMDDVNAANASCPCPTTKTDASDRNQLTDDHIIQTTVPRTSASTNTGAGCGSDFDDTNPARIRAPRNPAQAASASAARRKCSPVN